VTELEAKFTAPGKAVLDEIAALDAVGTLAVVGRSEVEIVDRYFDTPKRELAAAHGSLRARTIDGAEWYTYKTRGEMRDGLARREEVEERSGGRDLTGWLYWLVDSGRASVFLPPDAFEPVLEIHNRRTILDLEDDAGGRIEVALDRARFKGPRGEHEDFEIELELRAGEEKALTEAAGWLRARFSLQPSEKGKYARALQTVG